MSYNEIGKKLPCIQEDFVYIKKVKKVQKLMKILCEISDEYKNVI